MLLISILCLGFFLRIYHLDDIPHGFFADEASIGYDAYSILYTGKDGYGFTFPIFFQSLNDYKAPIPIYSAVPFVFLFGLNEFSTRLASVMYGLFTILAIFYLGKEIHSKKLGLLCSFITANIPWLIHYDRVAFQMNIYATFFVITIFLFIKATHKKSFILPAFIVSALTLYTYQPGKLLIPLLLLGILIIFRKSYFLHKKEIIKGIFLFLVLSIPLILSFFNGEGLARFNMVSVFSAKLSFTESVLRIIHNYLVQLSPNYFIYGEPTFISRHFIGGLTPLLPITLPFLIIGLMDTLLKIKKKKSAQLLIYWLLIYPIAGAVTADAPFTSRSIIGAPLFAILISLGIMKTILHAKKFINNYILTSIIILLILLNLGFFTRFYFIQYPLYSSDFWGWQYGPREIISYFKQHEKEYDELYMIGEFNAPEIFFKFYAPNECKKCKVGIPENNYRADKKQLFAISFSYFSQQPQLKFKTKKIIYYPNGSIAFLIGEIVQ